MREKSPEERPESRTRYYWERVREHGKRYKNFEWPSVELTLSLIHLYDLLSTRLARKMSEYELSLSAFNVLMILSRSKEGGLKQSRISELLLVSRANMTGLVDSLVRRGFVQRTQSKEDRRASVIRLTRKGTDALEKMLPDHYAMVSSFFGGLGPSEKEKLSALLAKVRKQFGE